MYIRQSTRRYKDKTYTNYVLVASVQTPNGPRQKTVCALGDLSPRSREEWLKLAHKLEHALAGQGELLEGTVLPRDPELDGLVEKVRGPPPKHRRAAPLPAAATAADDGQTIAVDPRRVSTERHREAGPVNVGYQFWNRLGLDDILRELDLAAGTRQLVCATVLNRLIQPASEHATPPWIRRTALADILGINFDALAEDALYRMLDRLHPHRAAIEAALVERERSLFNLDRTIFLYDLSSTYFEGQAAANPKAQRGH